MKLTISKIWNLLKLWISYQISAIAKKPLLLHSLPMAASIEPTTACNLACPECPSGLKSFSRPTGNIHFATLERIAEQLKHTAFWINLYFQGEPFIHPRLPEMIQLLKKEGFMVCVSSNMHFMDETTAYAIVNAGLDRIIISIDGTTQETYEQYRKKGNLNTVLHNTQTLTHVKKILGKKKPEIIFQMLVTSYNETQIEELHTLARQYSVDKVLLKTLQVYNYEKGHPLLPHNEKYARYYRKSNGQWALKNAYRNHCWRMWSSCVFTWDGQIVPCCFDKDAKYPMGNILQQDLPAIWKGALYNTFRRRLLQNRKSIDICTNCSEGSHIWN